jgi:beta-glucosidase
MKKLKAPLRVRSREIRSMQTFMLIITLSLASFAQAQKPVEKRIDSLLKLMTLEEKVGQLTQYTSSWATGPVSPETNKLEQIRAGKIGALLNVRGAEKTRAMQQEAMKSRLKIPLLFGLDVIHGYKTTFPIPLAEAASWDLELIEQSARIAATEASAAGIHWTFAPMVDIGRDPRWGRVMEGAGEDTYLGSLVATARVKGFQGKGLGNTNALMACAKHFAAYGAAIGGRDYNSVDMSDRTLHEIYLPPFKAAADAGAATFMNSFNDLNGIPATGNVYLQRTLLKNKWKFNGFIVSDWGSIGEMVPHGFAKDKYDAALKALTAGSDMDMESRCYAENLVALVNAKQVSIELVNDAVRRVLRKKFELGLFDDPFRFCNEQREKENLARTENRLAAKKIAERSIVLLKNKGNILPISPSTKTIALIGPLAKSETDMLGFWNVPWDDNSDVVSLYEGIKNKTGDKINLLYAKGCAIKSDSTDGFQEALDVALKADIVILSVGEARDMSGEAKSRSDIQLPGVQEKLIKLIMSSGKPVIVIINAGRPLIFNWTADNVPAILYTWWLGSEAGNAIANVLFGDYNPSAKLPMTFPRSTGQIPIYYNYYNTGRPAPDNDKPQIYTSAYIDLEKSPKFPFGFGLSYTTFQYKDLALSSKTIKGSESIRVKFSLTNTGSVAGEEIVQLYLKDKVASLVRPVKELRDFKKIMLKPGESKTVEFTIDKEKLSFFDKDLKWIAEPGEFELMIGSSSADIRLKDKFELLK